jgi:hypothetical protein
VELYQLGLDRERFEKSDSRSWRGPCPRCGGTRRFVIFTDHAFPKWNFVCDGCAFKGWADQLNPDVRAEWTPEERRAYAAREREARESASAERRKKLAEFSSAELWEELAERMTAEHRAWWVAQGVPVEWQTHLQIGYIPNKVYRGADGQLHTSRAYSLPYFHTGFEFVTLQYRLFDPPTATDRYRFEAGLGTTYYQTQPQNPIGDQVIICEGAKKAIVTCVYTPDAYTVLGIPSKSDFGGVVEAVKEANVVYVLLDPDASHRAHKLANDIGPAAKIVSVPVKVDDAIVHYGATPADLLAYLRQAA